ncbi:MAG: methionine--tRNA ligase [Nanoarchaeota archaeon]
MAKKNKFYITTPIYYPNDEPHLGSAYTTVAADVLARWHRLLGEDVFFLTGTDEHGQKIQESADKAGIKPQAFVDLMVEKFKEAFRMLNISNNNFIRTTDKNHELAVKEILQKLYDKKLIYKGQYEAHYCVACEQYLTASELVEGKCPRHSNRAPELRKEETYMFKLSSFENKLRRVINNGSYCILPEIRRKEIINFLDEGLQDISISRLKTKVSWGIELPFDKNHTCFVWVDAFWNYVSGLGDKKDFSKFWPVDVQLMAKDIIRVHATIWPALLLALDYELPKCLFVHGYFTLNGMKMSKSLGNTISPVDLVKKYGADSVRYYFMRTIGFGSDGDVSESQLATRHNNELADKFGNLVSRVSALAEKYGLEEVNFEKINADIHISNVKDDIFELMEELKIDQALNKIFSFIDTLNQWVQAKKVWETGSKKDLYELATGIRLATVLLWPFIPETSEKVAKQFGFKISLKGLEKQLKIIKVKKSDILFIKVEFKDDFKSDMKKGDDRLINNENGVVSMSELKFSDWEKVDLKVGLVVTVQEVDGSDKLLKLAVDFGDSNHKTVMSGIRKFYSPKDLKNKKFVFLTNLQVRKIMGVPSEAMILAAHSKSDNGEEKLTLFVPDKDAQVGSKLG